MPIYYQGPRVLVTDMLFIRRSPHHQVFRIDALRHAQVVISRTRWLRRAASYELHARYLARDVCLFSTRDRRVFGQVRRALVRALEGVRDRMVEVGAG